MSLFAFWVVPFLATVVLAVLAQGFGWTRKHPRFVTFMVAGTWALLFTAWTTVYLVIPHFPAAQLSGPVEIACYLLAVGCAVRWALLSGRRQGEAAAA